MRCPICNHETSDESDFCGNCGAKLSRYKRAEENTPIQEQQPTKSADTASTVEEVRPNNPHIDNTVNANPFIAKSDDQSPWNQQNEQPTAEPSVQPDFIFAFAPKKKSRTPIFAAIAVVLVVAICALYFSGVFDTGPLTSIAKASDKNAESKSFDVNMKITAQDKTSEMDGTILFDSDSESIEFYFELNVPEEDQTVVLLLKNKILIQDDGYVDTLDISKYLDEYWNDYKSKSDIRWSDLLEALGADSEFIDFEKFEVAANDFIKNLDDTDYINEKLGSYEKTTENGITNYNFEFMPKDLSEELIYVFGDSFKKIDKAKAEDNLYDALKSVFGSMLKLNFKVENGYLRGFDVLSDNINIEVEFSDFGKAEIDNGKFEKYESYLK